MIQYLVMDVDGSLTDGKIYIGVHGESQKAFSVKDGYVINYILKPEHIEPIIITARNSPIVQNRCNELGIEKVYQGKLDKLSLLKEIVGEENLDKCAYFGDDILDLKCMLPVKEAGGIVGCPSDAVKEVKAVADYVSENKAGEGALREFAEWLVAPKPDVEEIQRRVERAIEYIKNLEHDGLVPGKYIVDDNFYYSVQEYDTKPVSECKLESHRQYIDVQWIVEGCEAMDIADIAALSVKEAYDEEKDIMFWKLPARMMRTILKEGSYVVLYPENAHMGCIECGGPERVKKIVGKVSISL